MPRNPQIFPWAVVYTCFSVLGKCLIWNNFNVAWSAFEQRRLILHVLNSINMYLPVISSFYRTQNLIQRKGKPVHNYFLDKCFIQNYFLIKEISSIEWCINMITRRQIVLIFVTKYLGFLINSNIKLKFDIQPMMRNFWTLKVLYNVCWEVIAKYSGIWWDLLRHSVLCSFPCFVNYWTRTSLYNDD